MPMSTCFLTRFQYLNLYSSLKYLPFQIINRKTLHAAKPTKATLIYFRISFTSSLSNKGTRRT